VTVRARLEAANPQQAGDVPTAVREATRLARAAPSAITRETTIAHALVKSLYDDGRLDELQVAAFAQAGKFDEACMSQVAGSSPERSSAMCRSPYDGGKLPET